MIRLGTFIVVVTFVTGVIADWPQWRGPRGTGAADDANPPVNWSPTENIQWKTEIPGRGHSTPIISGNTLFLTAAIPVGEKLPPRMSGRPGAHDNLPITSRYHFVVIALNRITGKVKWQKTMTEAIPHEGGHYSASLASASPVTDGTHLYAFFGSYGLYCLDFEGNVKWGRLFGAMHTKHGHGEGSSPTMFKNTVVVNWDHEEQSFLIAIDKRTGQIQWRKDRDEVTSWSSPIVTTHDDIDQVIVCGTDRVRGYRLDTGDIIWECGGMSANIVATPIVDDGILFVGSSYEKRALMAIDLTDARGDITDTKHVLWSKIRGTPYVPSPLLVDGGLYYLTHYQNVLTRVHAKTGEDAPGAMRLGELRNIYASPVAAGGHVYITDLHGVTLVIASGELPRAVAVNEIDDRVNASLAIVGNQIFIRGEKFLYCIAESK